ncbi:MAG: hypothetical protein ACI9VL_001165 [Colwellia sp.]
MASIEPIIYNIKPLILVFLFFVFFCVFLFFCIMQINLE